MLTADPMHTLDPRAVAAVVGDELDGLGNRLSAAITSTTPSLIQRRVQAEVAAALARIRAALGLNLMGAAPPRPGFHHDSLTERAARRRARARRERLGG